jgi:hypothetical protein
MPFVLLRDTFSIMGPHENLSVFLGWRAEGLVRALVVSSSGGEAEAGMAWLGDTRQRESAVENPITAIKHFDWT